MISIHDVSEVSFSITDNYAHDANSGEELLKLVKEKNPKDIRRQ